MTVVRVDYVALAAVASHWQPLSQGLMAAHQDIVSARVSAGHVGDPAAAASADELLRQLACLVDMGTQTKAGLARALTAATTDYATAEDVVVRSTDA